MCKSGYYEEYSPGLGNCLPAPKSPMYHTQSNATWESSATVTMASIKCLVNADSMLTDKVIVPCSLVMSTIRNI